MESATFLESGKLNLAKKSSVWEFVVRTHNITLRIFSRLSRSRRQSRCAWCSRDFGVRESDVRHAKKKTLKRKKTFFSPLPWSIRHPSPNFQDQSLFISLLRIYHHNFEIKNISPGVKAARVRYFFLYFSISQYGNSWPHAGESFFSFVSPICHGAWGRKSIFRPPEKRNENRAKAKV